MDRMFFVDEGAVYQVWSVDDEVFVKGLRTAVTYRSVDTWVALTGKVRHFGSRIGLGQRAILHLDTGEGMVALPGVYAVEH